MSAMRSANLVAESVSVCCPHCGAPAVEPRSGSEAWTHEDLRRETGRHFGCGECGLDFVVRPQRYAEVYAWSEGK